MFKVESYKKGIILSTILNVVNKGLVFISGLLVLYLFNVKSQTDLYFYLSNSILIVGAFVSGLNSSVLIPEFMNMRIRDGEKQSVAFINFFLFLFFCVIIVSVLLMFVDMPSLFGIITNFREEDLHANEVLLRISLPLFGMICLINLLTDVLAAMKAFSASMMAGIINGICFIVFVFAFHERLGAESTLYALLISYMLNILLLIRILVNKNNWNFRHINLVSGGRIWKNIGVAQLGNFTSSLFAYIPVYVLSGFNPGIVTALIFSQQLATLPNSLLLTQFSAVSAIKFNELYAQRKTSELNTVFGNSADIMHFLMIPISIFMFLFSPEIVHVVIGFTSLSADVEGYVVLFTRYLSLILPFYVLNTLMSRLFMAAGKVRQAVWFQTIMNSILIILIYVLVKAVGPVAYPLTLLGVYVAGFTCLLLIVGKLFPFISNGSIATRFLSLYFINVIAGGLIYLLFALIEFPSPLLKLISGGFLFAATMLVTFRMLGLHKTINVNPAEYLKRKALGFMKLA